MGVTITPEAPRGRKPVGHAVDELYREHGAEVYRYAYGVLGNRADAEDMTQSTFLNALRAIERGERPRKPGNWLITIAHNLARERFRRTQARPTEVSLDVDTTAAHPTSDEDALSVAELMRALGRIPAAQRSALVMREFEGRSYTEIARILEITTSALETLLFRARRSLAEELENVVTCEQVEQDLGQLREGSLGRKDRRRLADHLRECPSCKRLQTLQPRPRRALRGLAWLPLPFPLNLFRGGHRVLTTVAAHGPEAATGATGASVTLGGGLAAKVAVIVLSTTVAGGVGYAGVDHIRPHRSPPQPPARKANGEARHTRAETRVVPAAALAHPTSSRRGVTHPGGQSDARMAHPTPRRPAGAPTATSKTAGRTPRVTRAPAQGAARKADRSPTAPGTQQVRSIPSGRVGSLPTPQRQSAPSSASGTSGASSDAESSKQGSKK